MSAERTKAVTGSSIRSTTARRPHWRPSKLELFRIKVATIVAAAVLFLASLAGIAIYNPGVAQQAAQQAPAQQVQHITIVQPGSSGVQVVPSAPRVTAVRPFVRTRGS